HGEPHGVARRARRHPGERSRRGAATRPLCSRRARRDRRQGQRPHAHLSSLGSNPLTQETNSIDRIAAWAGALEAGQVPAAAFALAKKAFLDTLAVSLSGSQLDSARIVTALARELGQGSGACSVIGHG